MTTLQSTAPSPVSNYRTLSRIERLLLNPPSDMSLDELRQELNDLAHLRTDARLSFCKRIAVAYMLLVGHTPNERIKEGRADARKFYSWCYENIKSANGKHYSRNTLQTYVKVGFDVNPAMRLTEMRAAVEQSRHKSHEDAKLGQSLRKSIARPLPQLTKLPAKICHTLTEDVSTEVNMLVSAWEKASPQARTQFLYMVTGRRF